LFNTKPELEFEDELKKLSISHSRNFRLGNRLYDFKIGDTLIEIDGPYHYDFKMYGDRTMSDDKRKELFKVNQDIDLLKNQIAKDNNYPLYRIKVGGCLPSDWKERLISQGCTLFI
jgi:hypothetical protein